MKKLVLLLLLVAIGAGLYMTFKKPSSAPFELEEGYTWLYNGQNLDGWRVIGGESTFEADGESIKGIHGPGENTFLRTEETYADFNLRMQMRWDELGNSGVLFRAQQRDGNGRAYGYQYELDHSDRAWSAGIYDEARRGWLYTLENNPAAREAIKLDGWNDVEIDARGGKLQTWINGVPAATVVDGFDAEGFIALQVHSGDIGIMRWRNIRIQEFPAVAQPGAILAQDDWLGEGVAELVVTDAGLTGIVSGEKPFLSPKRRLADASVRFSVPACDTPTIVRMRYDEGETREGESFVEVSIFSDKASARLVNEVGVTQMEEVRLQPSERHMFMGVTIGDAATLSVAGDDVLRVNSAGLPSRGKLQILPAQCAKDFEIADFSWTNLRENREQVAFYKTLDTAPAPVLSPEQALESFRLAPGFEIELVAAEPLVEDPVAMAWDEYGRLYVVEMRGYMPDAYGTGSEEPVGQVVRLEDTDGDGQMDTSEVYLGALVNPRAVAVVNEGILIGEPPNLWLCEQPTRDALCTSKRSVGGYAHGKEAANVEHMENRLLPGIDNWLYNSKSNRRLRLSGDELQESFGPFRGQWGISKDDVGRLYYNNNSNWLLVDYFQGEDIIEPGVESYPAGIGVNLTDPSPVYSVRVNPGVNRAYLEGTLRKDGRLNRATGASGLVVYRGDQFPEQYRGHAFVPESAGNVVAQFALSETAVGVEAKQQTYADEQWGQRDFLGSTDERFRPVDAANGPDGSLYVIDMYRGIIQDDHFLTEELREQIFQRELDKPIGKGRIWRIRHAEGTQERNSIALAGADAPALVAALSHSNGWVRDTAQRLLMKFPGEEIAALESLVLAEESVPALHAIWTLQGRGELNSPLLTKALASGDAQRQIHALRAGSGVLTAAELVAAAPAFREASEMARMQYAFALGAYADNGDARGQLVDILASGVDNIYIRQAVVRAARGHELAFLQELLAKNALPAEGDGAVVALGALAGSAYRSIRPDMTSTETPDAALLALLELVEARRGEQTWQQLAMLAGFIPLSRTDSFEPARLEAAPSIFADSSISETDPLWNARLNARVSFTWPGDELALGIKPLSPEQIALMEKGREYYPTCANCHGASGAGTAGLAPALAGVSWVTGPPEWLARIILQGLSGPLEINGEQWNGIMPPHGHMPELDDETLAGLMIYLRRSWGNKADPVSVEQVAEIREASASRSQPWTVEELEAVPFDRGYGRFVGKYSVSFVTMTVEETPEGLYLSVPLYGEGVLEQVSETAFRGSAGSETVTLDFVVEGDGPAASFILFRDGEKITFNRKE
jgi:glucose/arabinose dehydrogenase/mono/diheme cytochrome c family protein